jgi:Family of unknown function (DUF5427)
MIHTEAFCDIEGLLGGMSCNGLWRCNAILGGFGKTDMLWMQGKNARTAFSSSIDWYSWMERKRLWPAVMTYMLTLGKFGSNSVQSYEREVRQLSLRRITLWTVGSCRGYSDATMSKQQEALQFLDDLDSLNVPSSSKPAAPTTSSGAQPANEAEALAFLDEITQKSSEPTRTTVSAPQPRTVTPRTSSRISLRKGADSLSRSASPAPVAPGHAHAASAGSSAGEAFKDPSADSFNVGGGTWGWGSVWSSASAAVKQARSVVDEQVKNLPKNEQAKKWSEGMMEYVKNAQLDRLGGFPSDASYFLR